MAPAIPQCVMFSTYNLKIIIITSKQNSIEATIIRHSQKIPEGVHLMNNWII